jgi:DNA-binding NtrC family response regulator
MKRDPRVLVVEDEMRMRELLVRAIGEWGMVSAGARSAEEALRHLQQSPADILILDLNLPGMDGMELLERVRTSWPNMQVIILTGFGDLAAAKQAIHLDVVEFLTKPCHLGDMEQAIDKARKRLIPQIEPDTPPPPEPQGPVTTLDEVERQHILAILAKHNFNRAATAEELGISLRTLYYRLAEYEKEGFSVS